MTPEKLVAIRERDAQAECVDAKCHQTAADRRELLEYVGELQGHLGNAFSLYLDSLMDMRLDDGEPVLAVLFEMNPDLREQLLEVLTR